MFTTYVNTAATLPSKPFLDYHTVTAGGCGLRLRRSHSLNRKRLSPTPFWQSYGATNHDDTPFLQRVSQWQRDKEKDADARKADGKVRARMFLHNKNNP